MTVHVPILAEVVAKMLSEQFRASPKGAPHLLVDCTFGGGGHTALFLRDIPPPHRVLAIDQDPAAISRGKERFASEIAEGRLILKSGKFGAALAELARDPEMRMLGIFADLGFSSDQLEDPSRGLSFQREGPLDMRLDPSSGQSAAKFLAQASESEIADVLWELGEERFSRRIARNVLQRRQAGAPVATTKELSELVVRSLPPFARHGKIHAATKTFQALRIHVNDELGELDSLLEHGILSLKPGGRIGVLSFHSLEDRKVKTAFRDALNLRVLTKKPLVASDDEVATNPRARSAKLRIAEKI